VSIRLRWKKDVRETGLRSVVSGPRGSRLHDGEDTYARVSAFSRHSGRSGWYYVTGWDSCVPYYNSCHEKSVLTEQEAKAAAMDRVRRTLATDSATTSEEQS
jgi:hypothetical protein